LYCCFVGGFIDKIILRLCRRIKTTFCMRGLLMRDFVIHGIPVKTAEENAPLMWSMFRGSPVIKHLPLLFLTKGKTDGAFRTGTYI